MLLTLAAALGLWLLIASHYQKEAVKGVSENLITINSYKAAEISAWVDEHRREALRLSRHSFMGEIVSEEISRPGSRRGQLLSWLEDHAAQKRYSDMAFLTPKGRVIVATPGHPAGTEKEFTENFKLASQKGQAILTDLYLAQDGRPRLTMFSPISPGGRGGRTLCVLVIDIDPEAEFYPLVKAAPLFFKSAETLVARKYGENVLFLNQLDYKKNSALKLRLPLSTPKLSAAAALKGRYGFFEGVDYRGIKVFSATGPVEGTNWVVVTKLDRDALLAPVRTWQYMAGTLLLLAALVFHFGFHLFLLHRERSGREKLRENERRLTALFSNLPGTAYRCANDRAWTMEFLSEGCFGLTGYKPEELQGSKAVSFNELIIPEDRERVWQTIQDSLSKSGRYQLTYSIKGRDGAIKNVWEQGLGVKGPDGSLEALEGYISDITPLKRAEKSLQVSERVFREFLEHSPIYVFFKDENIRPVHLSRNYETLLGKPLDELLGKSMDELFPSDLAKSMVADDMKVLREGKEVAVEEELNGRSYITTKFPISIEGKTRYLAGFTIDVTENKRAEAALKQSEEKYRLLTEKSSIGVFIIQDNKMAYVNPSLLKMFGYSREEAIGKLGPENIIHPGDVELMKKRLRERMRGTEQKENVIYRAVKKDGSLIHIELFSITTAYQGRPALMGTLIDVTGRRQAEEKALRGQERLRMAAEAAQFGVYAYDFETGQAYYSPEFTALYGLPPGAAIELDESLAPKALYPEDHAAFVAAMSAANAPAGSGVLELEYRIILPNNRLRWLRVRGRTLFSGTGPGARPVRANGIIQDITERKTVEENLKESEESYRSLFDNMLNGFAYCRMIYDGDRPADFVYLTVNKAFETLTGLKNAAGKKVSELIPGIRETDPALLETYGRVARTGVPETLESWVEALKMWFSISVYSPAKDHFVAVFDVITARKLAEQKLRESEARLRSLWSHMAEGVALYELVRDAAGQPVDYRIVEVNPMYGTILGINPEEITGKLATEAYSAPAAPYLKEYSEVVRSRTQVRLETHFAPMDKDFSISIAPWGKDGFATIFSDVTYQKKAENALRRSEARYRETVELAVDGILLIAHDGTITGANSQMQKLAGKPLQELLGLKIQGLFDPEELKENPPKFDLLNEGKVIIIERSLLRPDGTKVPVEIHTKMMPDGTYQGIYRDVAARKRAEEALKASEQKYKDLFEKNSAVMLLLDPGTAAIVDANPAACAYYGWSHEELTKKRIDEINTLSPELAKARLRATVVENTGNFIFKHRLAGGTIRDVEVFSCPVPSKKGVLVYAIVHDITERKRAEEALQQSEAFLKEAQSIGRMGSYLLDIPAGRWTSSEALDDIFGIEAQHERSVEDWLALVHPADRTMMADYFANDVAGRGRTFDKEYRIIRKSDGEARWVHGLGRLKLDARGRPVQMHGTIHDITERKTAEATLKKLNRNLAESKSEMENFLYITTHDLRSPLVNIQGFSKNLERYTKELRALLAPAALTAGAREELEKLTGDRIPGALTFVLEGARKMDALITALLKVSRIGRVEMKSETVDMNRLLNKACLALRFQLEEARGEIKCGPLPPCKADPAAVSQLFSNLLDNAVKYRHKDRALAVTVQGAIKDGMAVYTVADNGSGIPETDLRKIWNVFYQSDRTPGRKGEGIGLPMVKRITEKNGGTIRAESRLGEGTVFHVELPAAEEAKSGKHG